MAINIRAASRQRLDRFFANARKALMTPRPSKGWISELRESLGMSLEDLGVRMGAQKSRVDRIEKDEVLGKVTLHTMIKTAEALDCDFVYFLVPKRPLDEMLKIQTRQAVKEIFASTDQTMKLESQGVSSKKLAEMFKPLEEEMLRTNDRRIWKKRK